MGDILVEGLRPVIGVEARVLVLGSMPGSASLAAGEYYAHPRNRFWSIMERLFDVQPEAPYAERCQALTEAGIALWDVLRACRRAGSLDRAILKESEVENDIVALLDQNPSIEVIALNGGKAARSFRHLVLPDFTPDLRERISVARLPSTSPANARWSRERLAREWQAVLHRLMPGNRPHRNP